MLREDIERPFESRANVVDVLELIRLFCEGHRVDVQDYLRAQQSSATSHDLVTEIFHFFQSLEPELDVNNVDQACKAVDTLTEVVQGNTSYGNSQLLLQTKLVSILERLVEKTGLDGAQDGADEVTKLTKPTTSDETGLEGAQDDASHLSKLRVSSLTLLLALLEGSTTQSHQEKMLRVLDLGALARSVAKSYERSVSLADEAPTKTLDMETAELHYMLLANLKHWQEQRDGVLPGQARRIDELPDAIKTALDQRVCSIEVVNAVGELERVYFRMPAFCRHLTRANRVRILWGVDRETPGKAIQDFCLRFAPEIYREMRHVESLESSSNFWNLLNWLHARALVVEFMFGLAIAQNVLLLTRFSSLHFDVEFLEYLFGSLQLVCSGTVFARHAIHVAPLRGPGQLIKDTELIFLTVASVFSVLGLVVSPLFFCFHLLDIVNKFSDLQNVFKAVTLNGSTILLTGIFGGLVVWIYAIVGYAFMADLFVRHDEVNEMNVEMCTDVFVCWVTSVSIGLRKGDIGEVMELKPADDEWWPYLAIYQISYYIIVITILLNLIFGIIIDTFSQLRSEKAANKRQMENTCFICGVDRFTFDTKGGGFQRHIDEDHCMWRYLYCLCYLWDKVPTEYNGWEQHVAAKLAAGDFSFLPQNNAIVLRKLWMAKEEEHRALRDSIRHVCTQLDKLIVGESGKAMGQGRWSRAMKVTEIKMMEELSNQHAAEMEETKKQVKALAEQSEEMRATLRQLVSLVGGRVNGVEAASTSTQMAEPAGIV